MQRRSITSKGCSAKFFTRAVIDKLVCIHSGPLACHFGRLKLNFWELQYI